MNNTTKRPGPFRSCLIPYTDEIFRAWFQERKTTKSIQAMLKTKGIDVAESTIARFIKVRLRRSDPHIPAESPKKKTLSATEKNKTQTLDAKAKLFELAQKIGAMTPRQYMVHSKEIEEEQRKKEKQLNN